MLEYSIYSNIGEYIIIQRSNAPVTNFGSDLLDKPIILYPYVLCLVGFVRSTRTIDTIFHRNVVTHYTYVQILHDSTWMYYDDASVTKYLHNNDVLINNAHLQSRQNN